jgi:curli biogenesis system outer membrane secretion channel CsgG|tara:strand:+ start:953 stop:1930 length:978 start_codon:yes stop_codon:yes gene_type:complete
MKNLKYISFVLLFFFLGSEVFAQKRTRKKRTSYRNQNTVQIINENKVVEKEEQTLKRKVAIARFSNETQYGKGLFYDKENDPMGKQAVDILSTKLASSGKFILLERSDFALIENEMNIAGGDNFQKIGADYLIIGSITEFGRRNLGEAKVFNRTKTQTVEAGVSIRLVDVSTGQIIYSEEGKGLAEVSNRTTMGLGQRTDYDSTLSDKAISAAISQLVENIINNCMNRPWKAYFLSYDDDGIIISGGKSQGLKVGDTFDIIKKGKKIKNPQTGMTIELPGKVVGEIQVDFTGGDVPENEFSMVSVNSGAVNPGELNNYYIKEQEK